MRQIKTYFTQCVDFGGLRPHPCHRKCTNTFRLLQSKLEIQGRAQREGRLAPYTRLWR